jgi:hypothetical protein
LPDGLWFGPAAESLQLQLDQQWKRRPKLVLPIDKTINAAGVTPAVFYFLNST